MNVKLPDGTTLTDIPEGTTKDQIRAKLQSSGYPHMDLLGPATPKPAAPQTDYSPDAGMSGTEKFLVGAGSSLDKAWRGVSGLFGADTSQGDADAALYQKHRPQGWQTTAGEMVGDAAAYAPVALVPGALPVQMAAGALASGAMTPGDLSERAAAAGFGGLGAGAGVVLGKTLGRLAKPVGDFVPDEKVLPYFTKRGAAQGDKAAADLAKGAAAVERLQGAGVEPTFGQVMAAKGTTGGRALGRIEEAAQGVPVGGSSIRSAREQAVADWQQATRNEATPPVIYEHGKPAAPGQEPWRPPRTDVPPETTDEVRDAVSKAYDYATRLSPMPEVAASYTPNIDKLARGVAVTDAQKELVAQKLAELQRSHIEAAGAGVRPSAATAQAIESDMKTLAARYRNSIDPGQQDLGTLFDKVARDYRQAWRSELPPSVQSNLAGLDKKYPDLLAIEDAARKVGAAVSEGDPNAYTPAGLLRASRTTDRSAGKRAYLRGEAPQQELAAAGQRVLGDTVKDSGTAERNAIIHGLAGLAGVGGGFAAGGLPGAAASIAGTALYGTRPVQQYLTGRAAPLTQKAVYELLKQLRRPAGALGTAAAAKRPDLLLLDSSPKE
jgi:hypothetical protein